MRDRRTAIIWLLAAACLFAGGGVVQQSLERKSPEYGLVPSAVEASDLLAVIPGGLKAFLVNYYWIRIE